MFQLPAANPLIRVPVKTLLLFRRRQESFPDDFDWLADPAGKERLSHKFDFGVWTRDFS
jgi:hypothetical protein